MAEKTIEQLEAELSLVKDRLRLDQNSFELKQKQLDLEIKISELEANNLAKNISLLQQQIALAQQNNQSYSQLQQQLDATNEDLREQIEYIDELTNSQKQLTEAQKAAQAVQQASQEQAKKLLDLLGLKGIDKNTLAYQFFSNPEDLFENIGKQVEKAGGLIGIVTSKLLSLSVQAAQAIARISVEQSLLADRSVASLAAATAANQQYLMSVYDVGRGNTALGIGFEQASKATAQLYEGLNTFSALNTSTRNSLVATAASLERLGISGEQTAQSIASLSFIMGISELQAADTLKTIAAMGPAMGVTAKRMVSDFLQVKDQLSVFGSEMDDTFIRLQAQSKATNVAVGDLLNLTNKFDTFEGAATQVAKLNAILGGPFLSSMAMIENVDPTDRINMLREAVNNSAISFEQMSYYERKAITEAGGFKSVEEAQRVLSMSAGQYSKELEEQTARREELDAAIQKSIPIQEKLSLIMANFAIIMEPVITGISDFLSAILEMQDSMSIAEFVVGAIIITLAAFVVAVGFAALAVKIFGLIMGASAPAVVAGSTAISGGLTAIGTAAASITASIPVLLSLAVVFIAIAAAAYFVGEAIYKTFYGLAALIAEGVKAPEVFINLAAAIGVLALAIYALSNPLAILGALTLTATLYGIADAVNSIETDKIFNFKVMMEKIVEVVEPDSISNFEKFAEKFDLVTKATNEVNVNNTQVLSQMLTATQSIPQSLKVNNNQTIVVKIGDRQFKGVVEKVIDSAYADPNTYSQG
jgi:hypothetical protein